MLGFQFFAKLLKVPKFVVRRACAQVREKHFYLKLAILAQAIALSSVATTDSLKPFESDGCSAFPEGTNKQNELWLSCCQQHDFSYWKGGSYAERLDADLKLKQCVSAVGQEAIANLMMAGVRVGGSPFFPTSFRWGYGWPYPRMYGELSAEEIEQVKRLITP
jgi:hypothetical protein